MATFDGKTLGTLLTLLGYDGSDFQNILVDSAGRVQADVVTAALATGAATATNQTALQALIGALTSPAAGSVNQQLGELATLITGLSALLNALTSVAADALQVNVASSALPTGATTFTQQTQIVQGLVLLADLRGALNSIYTDYLNVSVLGSALPTGAATAANQEEIIALVETNIHVAGTSVHKVTFNSSASAGDNVVIMDTPPSGHKWVIWQSYGNNITNSITRQYVQVYDGTSNTTIDSWLGGDPFDARTIQGPFVLIPGQRIKWGFIGCTAGDYLQTYQHGYEVTP